MGNPFAGSTVDTVYGYPGTAAQTYAENYSKTFVPLSDEYLSKLQPRIKPDNLRICERHNTELGV